MRFSRLYVALVALTLSAPAVAAEKQDCSKLEGKELKACEKANKQIDKDAKEDSRSVPLLPSQVDGKLAQWDATNPFATEAYRVRVTPTEIQQIDDYLMKAAKIRGTVVFARYYVDQAGAGNLGELTTAGPILVGMLTALPTDIQSLVTEGKQLTADLPKILMGPNAMKIPKITTALGDALDNLNQTKDEVPAVASAIGGLVPQ